MTTSTPHPAAGPAAARRSLEGLSLGDAFGERWFPLFREPRRAFNEIKARRTPEEPVWHWTDDTALARALMRVVEEHGRVEQDRLALCFALRPCRQTAVCRAASGTHARSVAEMA
ncbi:ADP-ribosylglycohydrolase family protein [Streptomyces sp. NPDC056004]|uniref:ADP-ribosylglycohydrolase family protein n=1 Tax=unclassified Streptomyces TaxID=2593676 RepID=UPI0035E35187